MRADIRQCRSAQVCCWLGSSSWSRPPSPRPSRAPSAGVVTDQATGGPLEAARVILIGPDRIETTNREGRYQFRNVAPGQLPGPGAPAGLRAGDRHVRAWRRARPSTARLRDGRRPGAARRDRHHRHRRAAQARGRQRGDHHRRGADRRGGADHRVRQPPLRPRGRRAGAEDAAAPPAAAPASGSAAPTASRSRNEPLYYIDGDPDGERRELEHARRRRLRRAAREPAPVTHQRPQSRRHRVHRDREGAGGRDAVRHPGLQRCRPDHDQARSRRHGRAGTSTARWVGVRRQYLSASTSTAAIPPKPTGIDDGCDGFCTIQCELDGACTQTSVEPVLTRSTTRPPARSRPACASSTAPTSRAAPSRSPTTSRATTRTRTASSGSRSSRRTRSAAARGDGPGQPDPAQRPRAGTASAPICGANVSANADLQANVGYTSSDTRFVENDNSFLTITGSGEASGVLRTTSTAAGSSSRPSSSPSWPSSRPSASSAASPATGGRSSWLSTRATLGYDVTNRQDVQFFPTGEVADYLQNQRGRRSTTTASRSPRRPWTWPRRARFQLSPNLGSKTTVGGQFFRDLASRHLRDRTR